MQNDNKLFPDLPPRFSDNDKKILVNLAGFLFVVLIIILVLASHQPLWG